MLYKNCKIMARTSLCFQRGSNASQNKKIPGQKHKNSTKRDCAINKQSSISIEVKEIGRLLQSEVQVCLLSWNIAPPWLEEE